ncbi:MAG: Valyl-tRNA synthetase [uncultured Solirubrobacteraceae bacterium]|uniref:Valine--tRNA ligase n=1 Tax=uncultured Solirubrobacteraceae bacterium TaxID=1162706 RepID=A0A6J4SW25_9ACTN|nr:MAG: Valyl-tRNA synthetase [uncultured Solirubrobacteraceae bacterium]
MGDLQDRTRFAPDEVEPRILARWLESGFVHPQAQGSAAENFSIAIPPPNVTGALHMGHALNGTIQDVLMRSNRMRGRRAKWILGTDHAGIATQRQVEKLLESEGTSRERLGRERFVERVWEWREKYGGQIIEQFKRLGATCDYEDERFTLDAQYVQAVLKVFVDLHEQGLIYRDNYMVNWDPGLRSAISDLEVEEREGIVDTLYSIAYPLSSGEGELVVATVRPETMLADTAVAVHPDDERYAHLVGQEVVLPLVGRRLPIIADDYVKTDFGTGALKITPGHDPNDFEIGRRHGLDEIGVIGEDGLMTTAAGERYAGLTALDARARVVADLEALAAIRGREEYVHTVPFSQRSGERVEPLISLQWFMRMDELAKPAIEAVTFGHVKIHPESQSRRYVDWLQNIRPWCISRQLWWGHQIPVWYRGDETYVGASPPDGDGWVQDPDVLDTWFSSALWPFATLGWPERTPQLQAFYPTDVLVTGRDILFLWVARMVMLGLRFTDDIPFEHVYLNSIIQAPDGRRMTKSLGTGIDPMALVDGGPRPPVFAQGGDFPAYGADAVRFGLLAMSSTQDVRFSEEKVQQGQALANKLYNATRFAVGHVGEEVDPAAIPAPQPRTVEDRWILSRLQSIKADTQARVDGFDFAKAALGLYDFIYGELCDWYLEIVKPRLADDADPDDRAALAATLLHVLRETLATAHPVLPFVTEELWRLLPGTDGMLATSSLPAADAALRDPEAEAAIEQAIEAVRALRGWRDSVCVRPRAVIPAVLNAAGYEATAPLVGALARFAFDGGAAGGGVEVASLAIPGGTVAVLESGDVDLGAAERRREEERAALRAEIARAEKKLSNAAFVAKAPPAVVQAERDKLARLRAELEQL